MEHRRRADFSVGRWGEHSVTLMEWIGSGWMLANLCPAKMQPRGMSVPHPQLPSLCWLLVTCPCLPAQAVIIHPFPRTPTLAHKAREWLTFSFLSFFYFFFCQGGKAAVKKKRRKTKQANVTCQTTNYCLFISCHPRVFSERWVPPPTLKRTKILKTPFRN